MNDVRYTVRMPSSPGEVPSTFDIRVNLEELQKDVQNILRHFRKK